MNKRLAISVSSLILCAAGGVLASTTTNTPGASCVAASGALVNSVDGASVNLGAVAVNAVCPADRQIAPALATKVAATVWVVDQSTTGNVCCTINSKNTGGALVSSPQVCSSGASSAVQALSLATITDGFTFSHFYVQCGVPATSSGLASKILTYRTIQD